MKARRRVALLLRALHHVRQLARDALDADPPLSGSHLLCALAEAHDLTRRALRRRTRRKAA